MTETAGRFPFPGILTTADGSGAVVWVETLATTGAAAYPITPSTNMGVGYQQAVADGKKNVWGETLVFFEPESEHSAASVCEGYALTGGRVSNFTSGQGLLLMKEVLYTIAGKRLPAVFNIGARALTVHSLNVHAGHDDVMGVIDCGWGMLFARNAQEAADLCLISRRSAEDGATPFLNIQDGFLTTHTVETVTLPEPELVKNYLKAPADAIPNLMDTANPVMSGTVQNQDAYMKGKVAQRQFYEPLKGIVKHNMEEFYKLTGRKYDLIESYMMEDAEYAIIGMGSYMETAKTTVELLRKKGEKVGVINVTSYRPFPGAELVDALKNVKTMSILERTDENCSPENPLARDIKAAFLDAMWGHPDYTKVSRVPVIQHGAGGLGGRDVRTSDFIAIVDNMKLGAKGKIRYCVGVKHKDAISWDGKEPDVRAAGSFSTRGHSIGGYGSVTTNKIMASVCGDLFDMKVQAFPKYGAEKKGLPTTYFLTISPEHIGFHQELNVVDAVLVNDMNAFKHSNVLAGLRDGGSLILQATQKDLTALWKGIPEKVRTEVRNRKLHVYSLDAAGIAREVVTSPDLVQRAQGILLLGVFLKITPFAKDRGMGQEQLMGGVEKVLRKYFGKRGEEVVQNNLTCVKRGYTEVVELSQNILAN
ncbi:MAG: pyruvate ferredoxin oxidoreductase [Bdellovibrionales bacterium RIFOXYC1_FULL_54_43]|nr:MAG: pyruvate ferredoxin oxidoreductase [Bdellovibrionales bacterium RIFOXYC1_FULL_54_43]